MITSCWILQAFFVCWPAWPLFLLLFLSKVLMITRSMILWFLFKWWNLLTHSIPEWSVLESKFRAVWQTTGGWGRQGFWALAWSKWSFRKCKHSGRLLFYSPFEQQTALSSWTSEAGWDIWGWQSLSCLGGIKTPKYKMRSSRTLIECSKRKKLARLGAMLVDLMH